MADGRRDGRESGMPGQARLSLVRESPLFRLMRGPSRHRELLAASTTFGIVDSVGPAGHLTNRRGGVGSGGGPPALRWARRGQGRGRRLHPRARWRRRRRAPPGGPHLQDVQRQPCGAGRLARRPGVTQVVMEATGQYWKPVWYVLEERGFELLLVNARHVKILPGRKTDVGDAAWLCELLEHGLLRGSFVPPPAIRELRDLTRYPSG